MQYKTAQCKSCLEVKAITNATKQLCAHCNKQRLSLKNNKEKIPLPKMSKKQAKMNTKYAKLVRNLGSIKDNFCQSCGTPSNLTNSHLIPRSIRKDLVLNPDNIVYHCIDCHAIWENGDKKSLPDFEQNMSKIFKLDEQYHARLLQKML